MGFFEDLLASFLPIRTDKQRFQDRLSERVQNAQADRIEQGTDLRQGIEDLIRQMAQGGAPPIFHLGTRPGEGSDLEEFFSQVQPNAELNKLMELLGIGEGSVGAAEASVPASLSLEGDRQQRARDLAQALLFGLGGGFGGGGGAAGGAGGGGGGFF